MTGVSLAGLTYAAEALRFVAVPAAAFELVSAERRERIEAFLLHNLRRTIKAVLKIVLVLYLSVVCLVMFGPYLVLLFLIFNKLIMQLLLGPTDVTDPRSISGALVATLGLAGVICVAALVVTVMPRPWLHALSLPLETFSVWASRTPVLHWLVPHYRSAEFVEHYETVFRAIENWLWTWLAWLNFLYFFFAKGLMLVLLVFIQLAFVTLVALVAWLVPALPAYAFTQFSDFLRRTSGVEAKGRIPLGALLMWALGEILGFTLATARLLGYIER